MAIYEVKREWSPEQLGYVRHYLLHHETEVKNLPACCVGSRANVSDTDNEYVYTVNGWMLESECEEIRPGGGAGSGGDSESKPFVLDGDGYVFGLLPEETNRFIQAAKDGKLLQVYLKFKTETRLMIDRVMIVEVDFDGNGNFGQAILINGMGVQLLSRFEGNSLIFISP